MTQAKIKRSSKFGLIFKNRKLVIAISAASIFLIGIVTIIWFNASPKGYTTFNKKGDVLTNGTIEVTFLSAQTVNYLTGYTLDEQYVYVNLLYTIKNISKSDISWKKFPYINVMQYELKGNTYTEIKDSEAEFDFNALQSYAMQQGIDYTNVKVDMTPDEIRTDADIIKIPKADFDNNKFFVTIDNIDAIVQIEDLLSSVE